MGAWLWGTGIFLIYLAGVVSAGMALMASRTSQGAIAWIVSLLTFPYLAVPAFWLFGRPRFYGYVSSRGERDNVLRRVLERYRSQMSPFRATSSNADILAIEKLSMMPLTGHNKATLLIDGEATFNSIFQGIDQARDYVLIQFFIVRDDRLGQRFKAHLSKAAERGVAVYFLFDEIGSRKLPKAFLRSLEDDGVKVSAFRSSRGLKHPFQLNFRNHRKVVVVDGSIGWLGGFNVGDEYLHGNHRHAMWRDTHLRLEGPSVMGLQEAFWEDWHWATGELAHLDWQPVNAAEGNDDVIIVASGPADRLDTASLMVQSLIHSANERLWVTSPYFVPDQGVQDALRLASMRGVDVRVMIPEHPDHLLVYLSAFAFLPDMLRAGVKIYRYIPGFLHQKTILVDSTAASVGTVNLDHRSFHLNFEISAFIPGIRFAKRVETMLLNDFNHCRQINMEELEARAWWKKIASRAAYLTSPIQ